MVFAGRRALVRSRVALLLAVALLVLAACNSDDDPDAAPDSGSGDTVETDDGTATASPEETEDEENQAGSDDDDDGSEEETGVEGATPKQQNRIDAGKPTLLIKAPEDGAQVKSPLPMRFEVLNGEIVENSADEDGYVIFVKLGKSSSLIPIYDDQGEVPLTKNGSAKVTAMLGGKKGPIKKTAVTITVMATGVSEGGQGGGSGD
jgi:hypothetical protein